MTIRFARPNSSAGEKGRKMGNVSENAFIVGATENGSRLDVLLADRLSDISRSQLQRLIDSASVQVNGASAKASYKTQTGDLILVQRPSPRPSHLQPQDINLNIVFEDPDIIVINKAKGMVVHPAPGWEDGTLVNALLAHGDELSGIGGVIRPGIVHRLDKDTTGLMVVAKNDASHNGLQMQIQQRSMQRKYLALSWGKPPFEEAVIDAPIGRHPIDRKRMAVMDLNGRGDVRTAITEVKIKERLPFFTLFDCKLQTGRTHQIRVHLSFAGFPIVGDALYGGSKKISSDQIRGGVIAVRLNEQIAALHGQTLHAYSLSFEHPTLGDPLTFTAEPPAEMENLISSIRAISQD
jgi:23S rRNA pseudouridine1911/1915/1917 synthase